MSTLFKNKYRIESTRLSNYDYSSAGAYFITICTKNKEHFFGNVVDKKMQLSEMGKIIHDEWLKTSSIRNNVILDEFMVMPNHIHIIIFIIEFPVETHCYASQSTPFKQTASRQLETETHVGAETHGNASLQIQMQYKNSFGPQSNNLSSIIRGFKGVTTKNIHIAGFRNFEWQPRFYDRIIRNELELNNARDYIIENPAKWWRDRNNKENLYM